MTFKNTDNFMRWLTANLKAEQFEPEKFLKDLDKQYGETGMTVYELRSYETKSGNPETISFEVEQIHNETNDTWDTIYTF